VTGAAAVPRVVADGGERLWFLGTLARIGLAGEHTGGRFAIWDGVLPHGAAPPLHSHPQDETFVVLDGRVTAWVLPDADGLEEGSTGWIAAGARACGAGTIIFAPGGTPHTFRVETDTARMIFLSTPAGIEDYVRALAEPAGWPWLPPPPDGPRVPADRLAEVERELGMVRHGPSPPAVALDHAAL
jgi:quercetin dioxygenase-like cupin family protein